MLLRPPPGPPRPPPPASPFLFRLFLAGLDVSVISKKQILVNFLSGFYEILTVFLLFILLEYSMAKNLSNLDQNYVNERL